MWVFCGNLWSDHGAPGMTKSRNDGVPVDAALLAFAHRLADVAAAITLPLFRTPLDVADKGDRVHEVSAVTRADRDAEAAMCALILATHPDHGVLGEEGGHSNTDARLTWVLDPIDGTKAFITGFPTWGTLIALNDRGRPILGIADQPFTRERFVGHDGTAALNGRPLGVRACATLAEARLGMTTVRMFRRAEERAAFERMQARVALVRPGGDCYSYCMVAHGLLDLAVEGDLAPWDIQALIPIVEGAGGVVTGWDGGPAAGGGCVIAAGDRRVHAQALAILQEAL